jgi:hypothetical protein
MEQLQDVSADERAQKQLRLHNIPSKAALRQGSEVWILTL